MSYNCARAFSGGLARIFLTGLALLCGVAAPLAQEQFYTQSGGHGLQNAKTNARLSKVEGDVDVLNVEMAKVKPHAKAELGSCSDTAEKLRYDGSNWICEKETDPTVQGWAKKALPSCTGGSIIGVVGGELGCTNPNYLSAETDPTVQTWAKSPLPSCGTQQILTSQNGALKCVDDSIGVTSEKDPHVYDFARNDKVTLPSCASNELLTMKNGALSCQVDQVGITQESDPRVQAFARNDVSASILGACAAGEVLRSELVDGKVALKCVTGAAALQGALALGDLNDVQVTGATTNQVLMYDSGVWRAKTELDPTVSAWAKQNLAACGAGRVLTFDGTHITCVNDAGGVASPSTLAGLADVNLTGLLDGKFLKYDQATSKWIIATVEEFAQTTLPTCGVGQTLTGDGSSLSCVNDAGGSADPLDLVELGDVRNGPGSNLAPSVNDFLRWNGSKWAAVHDKLSGTSTTLVADKWCYFNGTDVVCDRGAPQACSQGDMLTWDPSASAFICSAATSTLGLGTMSAQNADSVTITGGTIDGVVIGGSAPASATFTGVTAASARITGDLVVEGNMLVSGSQTINGVTFANGGLSTPGTISASVINATSGQITGDFAITGNLTVSGTQTIGGVTFANGGVSTPGTVTATAFAGDGSQLTNVQSGAVRAAGIQGSVQFHGADGSISGTSDVVWQHDAKNLAVVGSVQPLGTGSETCGAGDYGKIRTMDLGGGDIRLQICRP